jgi:AAT family amino acid transporter
LRRVVRRGAPLPALLLSTAGLVLATIVAIPYLSSAYVYLFEIALFGGLFVWVMIFLTHLCFRRAWEARGGRRWPVRMVGYPYTSELAGVLVTGIIATTWSASAMRPTILSGVPWLAFLRVTYLIWKREKANRRAARKSAGGIATSMELTRCV